jgi:hypothetical protein
MLNRTCGRMRDKGMRKYHWPRSCGADPAIRAVTATGLITVGVIHTLEIQGQLSGAVWLTICFAALAAVAPLAGIWLLIRPAGASWAFAGLVGLSAALGYILTRSVAMPGDPGDRGNWLEPLGLAALIIECIVVILAGLALSKPQPSVQSASVNMAAATRATGS